jgi:hypothetical protein
MISKVSKYLSVNTVQQSRRLWSSKTLLWEPQILHQVLICGKNSKQFKHSKRNPSNFKCKMWQKFPIYIIFPLRWEDSRSYILEAVQFSCHIAVVAQFLWQKECSWFLCKWTLALLRILSSAINKNIYYQDRTSSTHHENIFHVSQDEKEIYKDITSEEKG